MDAEVVPQCTGMQGLLGQKLVNMQGLSFVNCEFTDAVLHVMQLQCVCSGDWQPQLRVRLLSHVPGHYDCIRERARRCTEQNATSFAFSRLSVASVCLSRLHQQSLG